jgi:hypothetical protein
MTTQYEYLGTASGQEDWGGSKQITVAAVEFSELWVAVGYGISTPYLQIDGAGVTDEYRASTGWDGVAMGWKIVPSGSHTVLVYNGSDSCGVAVMRFKNHKGTPYLDTGAEGIAYGTEAPFPNQDLTAKAGGLATACKVTASTGRGAYLSTGGTILGSFTHRTPCDMSNGEFHWGYKIPTVDSTTEECSWTQDSYTTKGQVAIHMSFAPMDALAHQPQVI